VTQMVFVVLEHPYLLYYTDGSCQLTQSLSLFYDYMSCRY